MTTTLGVRLAVGQRTLNPSAEVRILDPQPDTLSPFSAGRFATPKVGNYGHSAGYLAMRRDLAAAHTLA
jgi:hypothetical protein